MAPLVRLVSPHTHTHTHTHKHTHTHCILCILLHSHVPIVPFFHRQSWISAWMASLLNQQDWLNSERSKKEEALAVSPVQSMAHSCSICGHTLNITLCAVCSTAELLRTAVTVQSIYKPFGRSLSMRAYVFKFVHICIFVYMHLPACCECTELPTSALPHPFQLPFVVGRSVLCGAYQPVLLPPPSPPALRSGPRVPGSVESVTVSILDDDNVT